MKYFTQLFFFSLLIIGSTSLIAQESLDGIQDKIQEAFGASFGAQTNQVQPIVKNLQEAYAKNNAHDYAYWLAFAQYQSGLFYLIQQDNEQSESEIEAAIQVLEELEDKNAEDHVLLGSLLSLSINFAPAKAVGLSAKANKHYQIAKEMEPNNMRVHLGIGRSDFFKPVQYGGGKLVEKHLLKALSLPLTTSDQPNAPTWGRSDVFLFLARYYNREDRQQEAVAYCQRGLKEFPNHSGLKQLLESIQ